MNLLQSIRDTFGDATPPGEVVSVDDLMPYAYSGQTSPSPYEWSLFDGEKFAGGFGPTQILQTDYWTLRSRSEQLFTENLYARGIIRRLITNEINTGLSPESSPDERTLGLAEDSLVEWTEDRENAFGLWAESPAVCDWKKERTFGQIQQEARQEALISGDVLVVLRQHRRTKLPAVQIISGSSVRTPWTETPTRVGHEIVHGVELDKQGRTFGFHVKQKDGTAKFMPAYGEKSGRRLAWLVYGTDRRMDDIRGQPLLSLVMQSLKEIDRYRDSAQRKAVINSIMAMFIKKTEERAGSLPMTGGAVRRGTADITDDTTGTTPRKFNVGSYLPGMVVDELQYGEEPVMRGGEGTDTNFSTFEDTILGAIAWANEMPPEILTLRFSNNYSASQAAINEFKIYLNKVWGNFGRQFCSPIWIDWMISDALRGRTQAPGLLEAWRDPAQFDILAAWVGADWYGSIKPSTDMTKQVKSAELLVSGGFSTRAREARVMTGTKFSKNIKRLRRENEQLADAMTPMIEARQALGIDDRDNQIVSSDDIKDELDDWMEEYLSAHG